MTIIGISASPRRKGNSETVLSSFLEGAASKNQRTKMIRLCELNIRPCQACDTCDIDGYCTLNDDMKPLYSEIASCSALVLATPIYFGSISAQLKIFIDRFQSWWHAKYNLQKPFIKIEEEKPAFFVCVGALKNERYSQNAEQIIKVFFHILNMKYKGNLSYRGYDEKNSISKIPKILEESFQAGANFAALI